MIATPATADEREGLASASFVGLLLTQFFGALNDNMFRWLIVPIGKALVDPDSLHPDKASLVLAVGAAMFVIPFVLFPAPAAFVADRFSKRTVIVGCKVAEVVLMLLGTCAILYGHVYFMFGVLFLMGLHSAMFSPSKYGSIPEIVRADRIPAANGWVGMGTFLAIILGTMMGGYLYQWTMPRGETHWWIWSAAIVGVAGAGLASSFLIRPLRPANFQRQFSWNLAADTYRDLSLLACSRPLLLAALGSGVFWSLGSLFQINVDRLVTHDFSLGQENVGIVLAIVAIGVALGNLIGGFLSGGRVRLGMVPVGALGIALSAIVVSLIRTSDDAVSPGGFHFAQFCLFALGFSAGLYDIPLQSFLQHRSPEKCRGSILAACNFISFSGMLVASGIFALLSGPLMGLSGRTIFLIAGLTITPVMFITIYLIPAETVRFLLWLMTRFMYRVRVEGIENLPKDGALLVANHVSWVDGVLLSLACPEEVRMVAYADYFENRWLGWFSRLARIIPIRPGKRAVIEAIRTAREALKSGELVGIFPEGSITRDGEIHSFQAGFLAILKDTGRPVVPVYLGGLWGSIFSYERGKFFWKRPRRWPYPVRIRVGRPIADPQSAEEVREAVLALEKDSS